MDIKAILLSLCNKIPLIPKELASLVSLGLIAIALVLIIVFFCICVAFVNSKPKPIIKRDDKKVDKKDSPPIKMRHEDLPIISGRMGEILTLLGVLNAGPITKIFFKVLEIFKSSSYDIRWRYKLPCFMMVGPDGSGKSTLLENLNFEHLTSDGSSIDSMWKLFQNGAIFELPKVDAQEDTGKFWSFISELFSFIRPRRPLDGIIVTLPADMLLSKSFDIEKHAKEMFERIFKFQHEINFHLPIYLIITKTDLIPGFNELAHLLHDYAKQQIFGWSCPYSINTAFSSNWIDEIFQTIHEGIRKAFLNFSKETASDLSETILFRYRFDEIKSSLTQYLLSMFRSHNPEDGLILRGVYFVGQQIAFPISTEIVSPMALNPGVNFAFGNSYNNNMYFLQDLFREKIFMECNIAYPIRVDTIDMNKVEQRNKIIAAIGSTVLAFGWFVGNSKIKDKIHDYYLSMASVKTTMMKIKYLESNIKGEEDQNVINNQITILLRNLPSVKRFDISSVFVPQSWFSSLNNELIETIGLVFDSVIIKAMYIDINLDTKTMLQKILDHSKSVDRKKDLFDVASFTSFQRLHEFTQQIRDIEKVSAEYNSIRQLEDRKSVADLTRVLFKEDFGIADEVKDRVPNKKLIPPKFDILIFKNKIESNLRTIFSIFLHDVLDVTIEKILQNVSHDVDRLLEASQDASSEYSTKDLAKLYNKTVLVADIFQNKNFNWISQDHFAPCQKYVQIMNDLGMSGVIGSNCIKELVKTGELEFRQFKSRLLEYKTDLTGNLLASDARTTSVGFNNFQKEIQIMLEQPFICATQNGKLITTILEDKMLIWDLKKLKELSNLIDKYYDFMDNMPKDMRAQYFEMYKTIARKCFYPIIESILSSAQIFDDMPLGHSKDLREDAYKHQALNIKNASFALPKIAKILDIMQEEDNAKDFGFSSVIVSHYGALLEKVDALFNQETPYSAGHAVFDNWDGNRTPQYLNIDNQESLKQYLTSQFERIRFLAKDVASPIVDLLTMPSFIEKVKDRRLLDKWKEIISSIDDYESKKPGNSIAALENFISESLAKVSIDSFDAEGEIKNVSENGGDYFLSKRSDVAKSLMSRAEIVKYERASNTYNEINRFFNANLANKFPFGKSDQDASLKDVENFIKLYEKKATNILDVLISNQSTKKVSGKAIEFLELMRNKLIPFLKIWIAHSKTSDAKNALVLFNLQTRPSPDMEALTSSVVDRELIMDNSKISNNSNFIFLNNNQVNAIFKYVASSDEKPNAKKAKENVSINGVTVTFAYPGKWGLFRLIEQHKTNREAESPNGVMLQFDVPIIDTSQNNAELVSKIVMKITPLHKDGDKSSPMAWPIFPTSCPNLHQDENNENHESNENNSNNNNNNNSHNAEKSQPPHSLDVAVSFDEQHQNGV